MRVQDDVFEMWFDVAAHCILKITQENQSICPAFGIKAEDTYSP